MARSKAGLGLLSTVASFLAGSSVGPDPSFF